MGGYLLVWNSLFSDEQSRLGLGLSKLDSEYQGYTRL